MKAKIHCTDLDQYLWYQRIESMAPGELRNRLLRLEPPPEKAKMGTALHSIFENPPPKKASSPGGWERIERDGYVFVFECDVEVCVSRIKEIRANKTYDVDGIEVTLTGKCDDLKGNKVCDHKLTFKPKPETYMDSYQWRAYLDIFNADVFEYFIYHGYAKGKEITIRDFSAMQMYRYPGMKDDLIKGIRDLLGFVKEFVPEMIQ